MIFLPVNGKRTAMPIDAPLVYEYRDADSDNEDTIRGGYGEDLAVQVFMLMDSTKRVHFKRSYTKLYELLGMHRKPDPYFPLPWDASHWLDLAIVELRENSLSSNFIKLIIKRSNRLHTLFGSGRGHAEYKTYS
ncbi:uncharacterized protein LOC124448807 [Xenia sp. Carnegie-2017]|uniref:uncharacterized protein LOC124448807 n=1 Tax=Xenia sp. Carnegie-2017 TaxID=2897299 RepID=UPI001F041DA5|nr:uncharacterized protein LOC124448807 [Xenia sp. Carnegie-2017]